jgi:hypothetical protein
MNFQVLHKGKILYKDTGIEIYSYKRHLFVLEDTHKTKIALPGSFIKRFLSQCRLMVRLFRFEPRTVIKIEDTKYLVSFLGGVYLLQKLNGLWILNKEHQYRSGMNNPLQLVAINGIDTFQDGVVYGEYWGNPDKEEVRILRRDPNGNWHVVYSFPKNSITHIHSIVPDPIRNCVYILTGDADQESGIWIAENDFETVRPIVIGKQKYRSCIAFPVKEGLLYATDTPLEQNYINLLYLDDEQKGEVKELHKIPGSCIYGTSITKNGSVQYVFSTTVEGDSRKRGYRALLSLKPGPGIHTNEVKCLLLPTPDELVELASFRKNIWPFVFQFGGMTFAKGEADYSHASPISVKHYDGKAITHFQHPLDAKYA